jgi:hypothetical protein
MAVHPHMLELGKVRQGLIDSFDVRNTCTHTDPLSLQPVYPPWNPKISAALASVPHLWGRQFDERRIRQHLGFRRISSLIGGNDICWTGYIRQEDSRGNLLGASHIQYV